MKYELEKTLKNNNIKPTAMRLLILKEISKSTKAINFHELEDKFERSGRATLYRTLKLFEEKHIIHPINDGSNSIKYALCENDCNCKPEELHVHFFCRKCEVTTCLNDTPIPIVKYPKNHIVETANYVLKGICPNCQK